MIGLSYSHGSRPARPHVPAPSGAPRASGRRRPRRLLATLPVLLLAWLTAGALFAATPPDAGTPGSDVAQSEEGKKPSTPGEEPAAEKKAKKPKKATKAKKAKKAKKSAKKKSAAEEKTTASDKKTADKKPAVKKSAAKAGKQGLPLGLNGEFELQTIYDDNIFRFSDENLLAYRRGESPWKFGMDTYDDFIVSPRLTLNLTRKLLGSKQTALRVKYTLWQYASNPEKSNDQWLVRLRQVVRGSDALELSYTYAPPAFIRPLSDRAPFTSRVTPLAWLDFMGTRNAFAAAWSGRIGKTFSYRAEAGRVLRYYNKPFLENDNKEWNGAFTGTVRVGAPWSFAGKYQYSKAKARACDTVLETFDVSDDGDGSYERDLYQATVGYRPGFLWKVRLLEVMGQHQVYWYTSDRPYFEDNTHTGRQDKVSAVEVTAYTRPVYGPVTAELGWRHTRRSSSSAATTIGADDIEEDKKYQNHRVWLGLAYPF